MRYIVLLHGRRHGYHFALSVRRGRKLTAHNAGSRLVFSPWGRGKEIETGTGIKIRRVPVEKNGRWGMPTKTFHCRVMNDVTAERS